MHGKGEATLTCHIAEPWGILGVGASFRGHDLLATSSGKWSLEMQEQESLGSFLKSQIEEQRLSISNLEFRSCLIPLWFSGTLETLRGRNSQW